jgi:hypothetical protein
MRSEQGCIRAVATTVSGEAVYNPMTEHCTSQESDGQDQHELMEIAERLFSPATPAGELERICMQLAHLANDQAQ